MMMKSLALAAALALPACSGGADTLAQLKGDADYRDPTPADCAIAQRSIEQDPSTAGLWNAISQTDRIGVDCILDVQFATGENLLRFIDRRMADGRAPTMEIVISGREDASVQLLLGVGGEVVPLGGDGRAHAQRAWTFAQAQALQTQLEETGVIGKFANGLAITKAKGGFALAMMFETNEGLRAYVADAVARGVSPAPVEGTVGGVALHIPLLMQVVGRIVPQPGATVSN